MQIIHIGKNMELETIEVVVDQAHEKLQLGLLQEQLLERLLI